MASRIRWENRDRVMAQLRRIVPNAEKRAAEAQLDAAVELANAIRSRARVLTGEYRNSIRGGRLSETPRGLVGIRGTKDPNATGIFALYIWRFLEFGTRKMRAFPHVFPTYREMRKRIRRKIAAAINKAVKQANG